MYADGKNVYSGRQNNVSLPSDKDIHILITGNWEYISLYMPTGILQVRFSYRSGDGEIILGYLTEPNVIMMVHKNERERQESEEWS